MNSRYMHVLNSTGLVEEEEIVFPEKIKLLSVMTLTVWLKKLMNWYDEPLQLEGNITIWETKTVV